MNADITPEKIREYAETSLYSVSDIELFIRHTGMMPTDEMKACLSEALDAWTLFNGIRCSSKISQFLDDMQHASVMPKRLTESCLKSMRHDSKHKYTHAQRRKLR